MLLIHANCLRIFKKYIQRPLKIDENEKCSDVKMANLFGQKVIKKGLKGQHSKVSGFIPMIKMSLRSSPEWAT